MSATFDLVVAAAADEFTVPWQRIVDPDCQWHEARAARRTVAVVLRAEFEWDFWGIASMLGYCGDHLNRQGWTLYRAATDGEWVAALVIRNRVVSALEKVA